jgi:hypothetical protein
MKKITIQSLAAMFFLVSIITTLSSCKDDEPSAKERNTKLITTGTWIASSVKIDGVNRNDLFTGFTLAFNTQNFTATNGGPVWGSNGTWSFTKADATEITRGDGVVIVVEELNANSLKFRLTWDQTTIENGREKSVAGIHSFEFAK